MNPQLIEQLKQKFTRQRPSITFGNYLGEGSFSITFAARDGRVPCAVKFSKQPWANDPGVAKEREALLGVMLDCNGHPHVGSLQFFTEIEGHLATQWELGDVSLAGRLRACQTEGQAGIPREELIPYMQQAAEGLAFINARAIVHRDIKPENLLTFRGQVKLVDFGFARLAEIHSVVNSALGTAAYAPPEASDGRLNPNVDIYCLAGTFIYLATGQLPFGNGADVGQRKKDNLFHTQGLQPHEIEALRVALAADPRRRTFATATEFVAALVAQPAPAEPAAGLPRRAAVPSPPAGSFRDKIRHITLREQLAQQAAYEEEAERRADLLRQFHADLERQFDSASYDLAYGTVNYLLRAEPSNREFLELKQFLEQPGTSGASRCEDAAGVRYALIPPGKFLMGSTETPDELHRVFPYANREWFEWEVPAHWVQITSPFYMAIHPITVDQFQKFAYAKGYKTEAEADGKGGMGFTPAGTWEQKPEFTWRSPGFSQEPTYPVVNVSWNDAKKYVDWHRGYAQRHTALATEAQWEYACRAGTTTRHYAGNDPECLVKIGNVADASAKKKFPTWKTIAANDGYVYTSPVGKFQPNAFGLYDMIGNVWEWCSDYFAADYYGNSPADDPRGPPSGSSRVLRGGSWDSRASYCRSALRYHYDAANRCYYVGFRVVLSESPSRL